MKPPDPAENFRLALVGVPNCGKTALFNRLTGSRQKVANYPGVTIERKEGSFASADRTRQYQLIDLPGTYSLLPVTLDEAITRDAITGKLRGEVPPDLILCIVAATNLRLSLRLVLELKRIGRPMIVALNMSDLARQRGYKLDRAQLESRARGARGRDRGRALGRRTRAGGGDRRAVRYARRAAHGRSARARRGSRHRRRRRRARSSAGAHLGGNRSPAARGAPHLARCRATSSRCAPVRSRDSMRW